MANSHLTALLLGVLLAVIVALEIRRYVVRRQFARQHGCQPVLARPNKEPLLGLDIIPSTLRAFRQHKLLEQNCELFRTHGSTLKLTELQRRIILTIEPENIKTILSVKFQDYSLGHRLEAFRPLLGEGIFDTDGDHWASSRALIRPSFSRDKVADLTMFETLIKDLFTLLPRDGKTTVDLQELFFKYTIDSATDFLFGKSVGTLRKSQSDLDFAQAFHYSQNAVLFRIILGFFSKMYRDPKADQCNRICREYAQQFVDEAFEAVESRNKAFEQHPSAEAPQHRLVFSHDLASRTSDRRRVLDEVMNLLLAGRDTTASLLGNLLSMLARKPAIWAKLRREVAHLQGKPPIYEELRALKYVQCCLNESLRLHPVVPRNERQAVRDTVLPLGGGKNGAFPVFVPKGTMVSYNLYAMHRRPDIYGPDAEEFRPERWEDGKLLPRWAYLPFNGGARICIGQRYALSEVGYVLVRMVQEFESIRSTDDRPWEESLALTLCSRNGARVVLVPSKDLDGKTNLDSAELA